MRQERVILFGLLLIVVGAIAFYMLPSDSGHSARHSLGSIRNAIYAIARVFEGLAPSADTTALQDFESSREGQQVARCAGPTGDVAWKIFVPENQPKPEVMTIQADLSRDQKSLSIQWVYNTRTKIHQLSYVGNGHAQDNIFTEVMDLELFCGFNFNQPPVTGAGQADGSDNDGE